jgi:hypothetical protein
LRSAQGPAYQPLNEFLREVSKLGASWRRQLARSHQFSYAATVRHLSNGLRKLARMNTEVGEQQSRNWRISATAVQGSGVPRALRWC